MNSLEEKELEHMRLLNRTRLLVLRVKLAIEAASEKLCASCGVPGRTLNGDFCALCIEDLMEDSHAS